MCVFYQPRAVLLTQVIMTLATLVCVLRHKLGLSLFNAIKGYYNKIPFEVRDRALLRTLLIASYVVSTPPPLLGWVPPVPARSWCLSLRLVSGLCLAPLGFPRVRVAPAACGGWVSVCREGNI